MAKRGSNKQRSLDHENDVAYWYSGKRSPSSGAADNDAGDVRTEHSLIECKTSGGPGGVSPVKATPRIVQWLEKIAEEAWAEGKEPVVALRYYAPLCTLSDTDGWVDVSVRLMKEDALRDRDYNTDDCGC